MDCWVLYRLITTDAIWAESEVYLRSLIFSFYNEALHFHGRHTFVNIKHYFKIKDVNLLLILSNN